LFTSGTTGRPKAVVHSLNTLTAGAANMARITGADERTVPFLVSPLTSITGVMQMHLVADQHATLVLEDSFEPQHSLDRIERHGATMVGGAPVIAERLLRAADARPGRRIALRTLALGGAMLPMPLLEQATDRFGIEVARVYGSSEAPNSTGSRPGEPRARRLADDGVLMPGTEVRIGSDGYPQEGLLRGPALFLGYADAEDNIEAFEDGWFRTGDAVEQHDGRLTVIGRIKDVVNRNGLKIAPSEIDTVLARLPGVIEFASFGVPDPETGERLALALRPEHGTAITLDDVCAYLRAEGTATRKLPEQLVVWDEPLPRTVSGKVVRSRLVMESPAKHNEYAPRLRADDPGATR
jgi:acyl-CoA synthetase (AMP-forming)/AMP-acid ligase II